jgi:cytochrome c-type biogenesis protein
MTVLDISAPGAFLAGILSFLSPCVLPLVPSYLSYITGSVFSGAAGENSNGRIGRSTALFSLLFITGFSSVFVSMGIAASYIGGLLIEYREVIRIGGGMLIVAFGLHIAGWLRIGALNSYFKFEGKGLAPGYLRSLLAGMIFAAGWTPCVGPILGSILVMAGTAGSVPYGALLLGLYSLGLALPFFIISLSANYFLAKLKHLNRWIPAINMFSGAVLIAAGILLMTGMFDRLAYIFY